MRQAIKTQAIKTIDLNADIGEADNADWAWAEAQIIMAISSANIACGGHAGNAQTMRETVQACRDNGVSIGAHPAYPDRENFGRKSMQLGTEISAKALRRVLSEQIISLAEIAADHNMRISYVKPHGALYNDAVTDMEKAQIIAQLIAQIDPELTLLGAPNSCMEIAAQQAGLNFVPEGFIDRRYSDAGQLLARSEDGAVISCPQIRVSQMRGLIEDGHVETASGGRRAIQARSLCLHGDSAGAVDIAWQARQTIEAMGVTIAPFAV